MSLAGVHPLAPSLDSIGPMAADVAGLVRGMALLEPGFGVGVPGSVRIGRVRLPADPVVDRAVDNALRSSEFEVVEVSLPGWEAASTAALTLLEAEAWASDHELVERHPESIGADVLARLHQGREHSPAQLVAARRVADTWRASLAELLLDVDLIAAPTLLGCPPRLEDAATMGKIRGLLVQVNLVGLPALALPVRADEQPVPASLQLIGPHNSEAQLLETGLVIEAAGVAS